MTPTTGRTRSLRSTAALRAQMKQYNARYSTAHLLQLAPLALPSLARDVIAEILAERGYAMPPRQSRVDTLTALIQHHPEMADTFRAAFAREAIR